MYMCPIPNSFWDGHFMLSPEQRNVKMHSDKQWAMFSHELQSVLMLMAQFSKMYYTR
jgi:hypothetical protein